MKTVKTIMDAMRKEIKKKFFIKGRKKFNSTREKLQEMAGEIVPAEDLKRLEEYLGNYNTTTRWQTL